MRRPVLALIFWGAVVASAAAGVADPLADVNASLTSAASGVPTSPLDTSPPAEVATPAIVDEALSGDNTGAGPVADALPAVTHDITHTLGTLAGPFPLDWPLALSDPFAQNETRPTGAHVGPPRPRAPWDALSEAAPTQGPRTDAPDPAAESIGTLAVFTTGGPGDPARVPVNVAITLAAVCALLARLFSRFRKENVLSAAPRARIHDLARELDGATLAELQAATGLSRGAVVHHCQMLEQHGILVSRYDGLRRRYFAASGPRASPSARPPTPGEARVLAELQTRGALTQTELARALGVTVQAVSYHLARLDRDGRIVREPALPASRYRFKDDDRTRLAPADAPPAQ